MIITEKFKSGREFAEKYVGKKIRFTYECGTIYEGIVFGFRWYNARITGRTDAMIVSKNDERHPSFHCYEHSRMKLLTSSPRQNDTCFSFHPNEQIILETIEPITETQLEYIRNIRNGRTAKGI